MWFYGEDYGNPILPPKVRLYIRILRKLGIKQGMASYANHWYERPLRILFFPIRALKNKLWWLTKGPG